MGEVKVYTKEEFMRQVKRDLAKKELAKREDFYARRREFLCSSAEAVKIDAAKGAMARQAKRTKGIYKGVVKTC